MLFRSEYLNQNLSKDFPLIALSTYAYMNISKFKYVFKTGVSQMNLFDVTIIFAVIFVLSILASMILPGLQK